MHSQDSAAWFAAHKDRRHRIMLSDYDPTTGYFEYEIHTRWQDSHLTAWVVSPSRLIENTDESAIELLSR